MEMESTEQKLEEYRQRVNSLLKSYKETRLSSSNINLESTPYSNSSPIPPTQLRLGPPNIDLVSLSQESDQLVSKATMKLRKLESSLGKLGPLKWLKQWRIKRKAEVISTDIDNFLPKLREAKENTNLWIDVLKEQKLIAFTTAQSLSEDIKNSISKYETLLDFYDELSNDCRQINFDVSQIVSELLISICFNSDVLSMTYGRKRRTPSNK